MRAPTPVNNANEERNFPAFRNSPVDGEHVRKHSELTFNNSADVKSSGAIPEMKTDSLESVADFSKMDGNV